MNGPPLTPQEAMDSVARRVRRLEAQGLDRDQAIRRAAVETGLEPHKVRWCVEPSRPVLAAEGARLRRAPASGQRKRRGVRGRLVLRPVG